MTSQRTDPAAELEAALDALTPYEKVEFYADAYKAGVVDRQVFRQLLHAVLIPKDPA